MELYVEIKRKGPFDPSPQEIHHLISEEWLLSKYSVVLDTYSRSIRTGMGILKYIKWNSYIKIYVYNFKRLGNGIVL